MSFLFDVEYFCHTFITACESMGGCGNITFPIFYLLAFCLLVVRNLISLLGLTLVPVPQSLVPDWSLVFVPHSLVPDWPLCHLGLVSQAGELVGLLKGLNEHLFYWLGNKCLKCKPFINEPLIVELPVNKDNN